MPQYAVTDRATGKSYDMPWDGQQPPTDADVDAYLAKQGGKSWTDTAVEALPSVMGGAYGLASKVPVVGTALAGLGGAAGEGYRQTIDALRGNWSGVPESALDRIKAMVAAGAEQAGYEGGGRAVGRGLQMAGQKLYTSAIKPSASVLSDMAGAMKRGVSEGILSPTRAAEGTTASREAVDALLAREEAAGTRGVTTSDVAGSLAGEPSQSAERRVAIGMADERPGLRARAAGIHRANPGGEIPLTRANALKREAQTVAFESGRDNLAIKKQGEEAIANALKSGIERRVPQVGPMNQKTQDYLGLSEALDAAKARWQGNQPWVTGAITGSTVGGAASLLSGDPLLGLLGGGTSALLASPAARARTGIGLYQVGREQVAPNVGRATGAAVKKIRKRGSTEE